MERRNLSENFTHPPIAVRGNIFNLLSVKVKIFYGMNIALISACQFSGTENAGENLLQDRWLIAKGGGDKKCIQND